MYLPKDASKARIREAQRARDNRAEIKRALHTGQISRRELLRMGIFTTAGALAYVNGLSPYATSAYAGGSDIPTGVPRSPLFGAQPFTIPMPRLPEQERHPLTAVPNGAYGDTEVAWPVGVESVNTRRLSWHTDFTNSGGAFARNPLTGVGPMEGRPPGEFFAHQRWDEILPQVGTVLTLGQVQSGTAFHPNMPAQGPNAVWTFAPGRNTRGVMPPPLVKVRYGEPMVLRHYNALPLDPHENGGFGSHDQSTHNHNAHNSGASDGAANNHFFPGQFYDYHWSAMLARHDLINTDATDPRASAPDGNGGLNLVPGDFREIQSSLWFHDHRFFLTAENVYKGHLGLLNYYSGPDRGNEEIDDGVNLRLPSGTAKDWGNSDFDVNIIVIDTATDPDGQYFFDIFNTDGFLGDQVLVNFAYKPFFEVLPRKYRLRLLPAGMSRFWKWAIVTEQGQRVPFQIIANDGNLLPQPVSADDMPIAGVAERIDIVIDFSNFSIGDRLYMVNHLPHSNGRAPDDPISIADALSEKEQDDDPALGAFLEFRISGSVESVDVPGQTLTMANSPDRSHVPAQLTEQIPIVEPVRERIFNWTRGGDDPRDENGECFPSCEGRESFPWTVKVNGGSAHSLNANRVSSIIPRPGETEHWILETSGGWDHPIHLHFEEAVTIDRNGDFMHPAERFARKDVWRLPDGGQVRIQVTFSEFGGAYVNHCHNTVHEDNAMLMRYDVLTDPNNPNTSQTHASIIPTPDPKPEGVTYRTPEILPEGNPFDPNYDPFPNG